MVIESVKQLLKYWFRIIVIAGTLIWLVILATYFKLMFILVTPHDIHKKTADYEC